MWVKICGNTRLQDCLLAAELGVDAVGFVFAEGKRTVTAGQVAAITAHLPGPVEKIGVFTVGDAGEIAQTAKAAGLTGIQLHGEYAPQLVRDLRKALPAGYPMRLLQVVHWDLDAPADGRTAAFEADARRVEADGRVDAILVDSRTSQRSGGTGRVFDWQLAAPVLSSAALPVIVAGGLNPGNLAAAVHALQPRGVDVSSGVEDAPGVKNSERVRRFIQIARDGGR